MQDIQQFEQNFLQYFETEYNNAKGKGIFDQIIPKRYFSEFYFRMIFLKSVNFGKIDIEIPYPKEKKLRARMDINFVNNGARAVFELKYFRQGNVDPTVTNTKMASWGLDNQLIFFRDILRLYFYTEQGLNYYLFLIFDNLIQAVFRQDLGLIDPNGKFVDKIKIDKSDRKSMFIAINSKEAWKKGNKKVKKCLDSFSNQKWSFMTIGSRQLSYFSSNDFHFYLIELTFGSP
jgi:hypothetical protein